MSDLREFPMQPPADVPEVIEINPLAVWPFLEQQWERDRQQLQQQADERARQLAAVEEFLRNV